MALATLIVSGVTLGAAAACGPIAPTSAPAASSPAGSGSASPSATPSSASLPPSPPPSAAPSAGTPGGGSSGSGPSTKALGTITVTRGGGIAGVMDVLVIAPDSSWVFTNRKTGAVQRGQLTASQTAQLAQLAANPALVVETRLVPPPVACSDSFQYTIAVGELSLHYDQCTAQGKRPVTDQLVAALLAATPL